jgi:hypothetical protein
MIFLGSSLTVLTRLSAQLTLEDPHSLLVFSG